MANRKKAGLCTVCVAGGNELLASMPGGAGIVAGAIVTLAICLFDRSFVKNFREFS